MSFSSPLQLQEITDSFPPARSRRHRALRWASLLIAIGAVAPLPAQALDRHVDASAGSDTTDCSNSGAPCLTIQYAIGQASPGDTIQIAAGTYRENVSVNKNGLTLQGAGAGSSPAVHTILDGSSPPANPADPGITITSNTTGVTIRDLRVQDYSSDSGIYGALTNDGLTIDSVHVVDNNTTNAVNGGGIYMNGPVQNVVITNVLADGNRSRGIVIWNGFKRNITITNNTVTNNNCCGIELQDGTASGVTMSNNVVQNNTDSGMSAIGLTSGAGPNLVENNTVLNNGRFGIEIKLPNGTGLESGDGSIVVRDNFVERTLAPSDARDLAGIAVFRRAYLAGQGYADIPTGVVVRDNTVQGYQQPSTSDGFGIVVEGTNMTVSNNTAAGNDVGIQIQQGHLPYVANTGTDGDQNNLADTLFGRGNSPVASGVIRFNRLSGNGVGLRNVGVAAASADQTCNWWGNVSGPTDAGNPGGLGQPRSGAGAFAPWLVHGLDADAGTDGFQIPASISVAPGGDVSPADNDFLRLANAIQCAVEDQTISLSGTFDWTQPQAAARWALGADGTASTDDDYWIALPANVDGVTLTAPSLGSAVVQGPGDLPGANLEAFLGAYDGGTHQDWTVSNLTIQDFDNAIGLYCCGAGATTTQYDGFTITNNHIVLATDLNATVAPVDVSQNIGIHFAFGRDQTISNNRIQIPGTGISDSGVAAFASSVGMQSNTSGGAVYDGLSISGNEIEVLGAQSADPEVVLGIWENAHGHSSDITVSGNSFTNLALGNSPAANLQRAFRVTSHSSATTTVRYDDNVIDGANLGFQWLAGQNFAGNQPVVLDGNMLSGVQTGLLVQSNGLATMTGNVLEDGGTGIRVNAGSSAAISCNRISGHAIAAIDADSVSTTANDNSITGNAVGVDALGAGPTVDAEDNWWGCVAGPGNPGCDSATANVDFTPFRVAVPTCVSCANDAQCQDGLACNGFEQCNGSNVCNAGTAPDCSGQCFTGTCLEPSGLCQALPFGTACDSGLDVCSQTDQCDGIHGSGVCLNTGGGGDPDVDQTCELDDNCPGLANASQADLDSDGDGDICDANDGGISLTLGRARLSVAAPTSFGGWTVTGSLNVNDEQSAFATKALANQILVNVRDADASFDSTVALTGCSEARQRIRCTNAARTVRASFTPTRTAPYLYRFSISARKLVIAETGTTQPAGVVEVSLHEGPPSNVDRLDTIGDITACTPSGKRALSCRER